MASLTYLCLAFLAAASAASAAATPVTSYTYAIKESQPVPRSWSMVGPAPGDALMKMDISLKQSRFDELERQLYEGMVVPKPLLVYSL